MKILITGCAKSGTTLVRRLFNAFNCDVYNQKELNVFEFASKENVMVAKRDCDSLFSNTISKEDIESQIFFCYKNNIKILNVIRDDSILFKHPHIEQRWIDSIKDASKYQGAISHTIYYKDLIANPDKEQQKVAMAFGLVCVHKWSEYPDFYDITQEDDYYSLSKEEKKRYSLRKIGENYEI